MCDPIDVKNANDVANLFSTFTGNFEGVVQYNKDNRAFEVRASHRLRRALDLTFELTNLVGMTSDLVLIKLQT